ncbi:MAG: hypothetical protein H0W88_05280 [Parachlamydiaceae bacterium]|nr:hypothetical protein [Parachlamydiaceae bacterium]
MSIELNTIKNATLNQFQNIEMGLSTFAGRIYTSIRTLPTSIKTNRGLAGTSLVLANFIINDLISKITQIVLHIPTLFGGHKMIINDNGFVFFSAISLAAGIGSSLQIAKYASLPLNPLVVIAISAGSFVLKIILEDVYRT